MSPEPIGIETQDIIIKRATSDTSDFLLDVIKDGSIYFFQQDPQVYMSVDSVSNIYSADDISEVPNITPFMFNSSTSGHMCSLCGSHLGEKSIVVVGQNDQLRVTLHQSCLFEFAGCCAELLKKNPEYMISELI